jgi:hypothetical protein
MTSFSSVGYGDITPASKEANIITLGLQTITLFEILSTAQHT